MWLNEEKKKESRNLNPGLTAWVINVPGNPLRKGKSSSIVNLLESAKCRRDDAYVRLCKDGVESVEDLIEVVWHSACYSSYTAKRNIQFASSIDTNDAASEDKCEDQERASRSFRSKTDWSKCFFCKKKTELINVSTFTACPTIKSAATIQGDEAMLHLLLGVNDDLMAAEAWAIAWPSHGPSHKVIG